MEALGLAAGMSYAPETGLVRLGVTLWYIDNKGVIQNLWRMPSCVATDWSKMGDRDVFGYMNHMLQGAVARVYGMLNIREGMLRVEKQTNVSGQRRRGAM
jgi:hypothetical protein